VAAAGAAAARPGGHRAVATRYDKLAVRYEATIHIAAINEWLRPDFLNT
jgi:transposase